jgi:hypothetical protein
MLVILLNANAVFKGSRVVTLLTLDFLRSIKQLEANSTSNRLVAVYVRIFLWPRPTCVAHQS